MSPLSLLALVSNYYRRSPAVVECGGAIVAADDDRAVELESLGDAERGRLHRERFPVLQSHREGIPAESSSRKYFTFWAISHHGKRTECETESPMNAKIILGLKKDLAKKSDEQSERRHDGP